MYTEHGQSCVELIIIQSELHTNMLMYKIMPNRVPEIVYRQYRMHVISVSVPEQK